MSVIRNGSLCIHPRQQSCVAQVSSHENSNTECSVATMYPTLPWTPKSSPIIAKPQIQMYRIRVSTPFLRTEKCHSGKKSHAVMGCDGMGLGEKTLFLKHLPCTSRQQLLSISFYMDLGPRFSSHVRTMFKLHYKKIIWAVEPLQRYINKKQKDNTSLGLHTSLRYCIYMLLHLYYMNIIMLQTMERPEIVRKRCTH